MLQWLRLYILLAMTVKRYTDTSSVYMGIDGYLDNKKYISVTWVLIVLPV